MADVRQKAGICSAKTSVMLARLFEAEVAVNGQANLPGIRVFLAIVFPPANWTQRQRARLFQGSVSAARAAKSRSHLSSPVGLYFKLT